MSSRSEARPERSLIRIVIAADTASRAQALATVLAEDDRFDVLSASGESMFTDSAHEEAPDILVAIALSPDRIPPLACPVVAVSNTPMAHSIFGDKVHAWLPLTSSLSEVSAAIFAASCDLAVLTHDQVRRWLHRTADDAEIPAFLEKLTPRELQVLRMLADGLGNKEIAAQLGLSSHTAKFHVTQILAKLGAGSRTEAVTIGIRRGLVPI